MVAGLYFTGDDDYQNFLVFLPMLNSLTLDNTNEEVTNWISTGISPDKNEPFCSTLVPLRSNLGNGKIILNLTTPIKCKKMFVYFIVTLF